jgi:hypothetical protein
MPVSVITLADRIGKVEARIAQANGGIEGEAAGSERPVRSHAEAMPSLPARPGRRAR